MARKRPKVTGLATTSANSCMTRLTTKTKTPKRRNRNVNENFHGKLSHASPVSPNTKITKYFHPHEENISKNCDLPLSPSKSQPAITILRTSPRKLLTQANLNASVVSNLPKPLSQLGLSPTPHKITSPPQPPPVCRQSPSCALSTLSIHSPMSTKISLLTETELTSKKSKRCLNLAGPDNTTNKVSQNQNISSQQQRITEFFPVRRSIRKTKKTVLLEKQKNLEEAVLANREEGLEVHMFEGKGRGIVTTRTFYRGEFVVEYFGQLITMDVARQREKIYAQDQNTGCYMYYFRHGNNQYCVDATPESDRLGRLVNHSRNGNLCTKTIEINHEPHLVLIAKEDIPPGTEITYDYGDRSKESLRYHPWLLN